MTELRTELPDEEEISTADMAAAGNRPHTDQEGRQDTSGPESARAATWRADQNAVQPEGSRGRPEGGVPAEVERTTPLFAAPEAQELHSRWDAIQTGFVDNPRQAAEQADHLVAQTIQQLAEMFANEKNQLEQQWSKGGDVSTEDLRIALQRYRSFFDRLLSF